MSVCSQLQRNRKGRMCCIGCPRMNFVFHQWSLPWAERCTLKQSRKLALRWHVWYGWAKGWKHRKFTHRHKWNLWGQVWWVRSHGLKLLSCFVREKDFTSVLSHTSLKSWSVTERWLCAMLPSFLKHLGRKYFSWSTPLGTDYRRWRIYYENMTEI